MPPPRNPASQFFRYEKEEDKSYCTLDNCEYFLIGTHGSNMESHIRAKHKTQLHIIAAQKEELKKRKAEKQLEKDEALKLPKTMVVEMDIDKVKEACLNAVTVDGLPFKALDGVGFRQLLDPYIKASGSNIVLNSRNIHGEIHSKAFKIRSELKEELGERLLCLKADVGSRHCRSVLGINVQFYEKGKLQIRTMGMIELTEAHTAESLLTTIIEVLSLYGLTLKNVYSMTIDNARNMVKIPKLIGAAQCDVPVDNLLALIPEEEQVEEDEEDEEKEFSAEEMQRYKQHAERSLQLMNDLIRELSSAQPSQNLQTCETMRCGAHTLQLAVEDGLEICQVKKKISEARTLVKKCRTSGAVRLLKAENLKMPVLDVATRWGSTYDMIDSLLELKSFCEELGDEFFLSESDWSALEKLRRTLKPAKLCTIELQKEQLNLGDFYNAWFTCKHDTKKASSSRGDLASVIVNQMNEREVEMFKSNAFISALYLDPRFDILLDENQRALAVTHIVEIWERLQALKGVSISVDESEDVEAYWEDTRVSPLERVLRQKERASTRRTRNTAGDSSTKSPRDELLNSLETYRTLPRLLTNENVFEFWEQRKSQMLELYKVACVLLSIPCTQVSVERAFSVLKYIMSDLRCSIGPLVLDDILLIKMWATFDEKR